MNSVINKNSIDVIKTYQQKLLKMLKSFKLLLVFAQNYLEKFPNKITFFEPDQ
jgi:hypothetical protein